MKQFPINSFVQYCKFGQVLRGQVKMQEGNTVYYADEIGHVYCADAADLSEDERPKYWNSQLDKMRI